MAVNFVNCLKTHENTFLYSELKVKHLKIIYKCLLGDSPDSLTVIENFNNILSHITNFNKNDIDKLSFVDFFLLIFQIRCTSIGNTIQAELPDKPNFKIEIN